MSRDIFLPRPEWEKFSWHPALRSKVNKGEHRNRSRKTLSSGIVTATDIPGASYHFDKSRRHNLSKRFNGEVYLVTPDGTTCVFRNKVAKQLRQMYSEQSAAQQWDFQVELNVEVVKPIAHPKNAVDTAGNATSIGRERKIATRMEKTLADAE